MATKRKGDTAKSPVHSVGPYHTGSALIEVSVWENMVGKDEGERLVYGIALKRSYRDGNEWKETKAFRTQDLPHVMIALQQAYLWIQQQNGRE